MQIFEVLGVNWSLLLAQIINFAIIAFILAKFVYKPVLNLIDERRDTVRKSLELADAAMKKNVAEEDERRARMIALDAQAGEILAEAKNDAEKIRTQLTEKAKQEAADILKQGRLLIAREREEALMGLQNKLGSIIVSLSEKILRREFTAADQTRMQHDIERELPALLK